MSAFSRPDFPLKLGLKDIRLALEAGEELAAPMPFASIIRDHYPRGHRQRPTRMGLGERGHGRGRANAGLAVDGAQA